MGMANVPTFNTEPDAAAAGAGARTRFRDFPGEKPTRADREKWCREARRAMSAEQQAIMRGAVPARLAVETAEFDLSALPALAADATSSDKDRRAQYIMTKTHENALKVAYREARVREIGNEMASDLEAAFEARAGQSWKKLKSDHQVPGHAGMLDGKAIFEAIEAVEPTTFNSLSTDAAAAAFAELQQMRLADGCSADDVSARFNRFTRDINPYLLEPKGDKGIVRWMLDEMPASCFNAVDAVERLAEEKGKLNDPVWVHGRVDEGGAKGPAPRAEARRRA